MILLNVWDWTNQSEFINILSSYLNATPLGEFPYMNKEFIDFNYYQLFKDKLDLDVGLVNYCYIDNDKEVYIPKYKIVS